MVAAGIIPLYSPAQPGPSCIPGLPVRSHARWCALGACHRISITYPGEGVHTSGIGVRPNPSESRPLKRRRQASINRVANRCCAASKSKLHPEGSADEASSAIKGPFRWMLPTRSRECGPIPPLANIRNETRAFEGFRYWLVLLQQAECESRASCELDNGDSPALDFADSGAGDLHGETRCSLD